MVKMYKEMNEASGGVLPVPFERDLQEAFSGGASIEGLLLEMYLGTEAEGLLFTDQELNMADMLLSQSMLKSKEKCFQNTALGSTLSETLKHWMDGSSGWGNCASVSLGFCMNPAIADKVWIITTRSASVPLGLWSLRAGVSVYGEDVALRAVPWRVFLRYFVAKDEDNE